MTINRCQICKVAWEDGQLPKHLMTCTINDFLFFPSCHRKPTEMEDRVMAAMAGWGIGDDRFEVARAVIRAIGMEARTIGHHNPFNGEPPMLLANRRV